MTDSDTTLELAVFFKALSDPSRLKIIGLLANQPYTVEELAAILRLSPATVSHHLSRLSEAGLVSAVAQGYYNLYRLDKKALENKSRSVHQSELLPALAAGLDVDAFDRKVIRDYSLPDGRLRTIPAQRKKLEAVLRHVVSVFQPGQRYPEKQVNELLSAFHEDTATLRRELVGYGLMKRERGEYWRSEDSI